MRVVRILVVCVYVATCHASQVMDKNEVTQINHKTVEDMPRDLKQKRDERSHPNKMSHEAKVSPRPKPFNLRLDTTPRKPVNTARLLKPIRIVPVTMMKQAVPNNDKHHIKTNDLSSIIPKVNSKEDSKTDDPNPIPLKPAVKQFFEDNDETSTKEHAKTKECSPKSELKSEVKSNTPQFTENDDDDNLNEDLIKNEVSPHIDDKLKLKETQNDAKQIKKPKKVAEPVVSMEEMEKSDELRTVRSSETEEVTSIGVAFNKNDTGNENKTNIKVNVDINPYTTECGINEPNDTSLIIRNHGFEELRERSTSYTADESSVRNQEPHDVPNWNYNPYNAYEKCDYNDPNNYRYDNYNSDMNYRPINMCNYQLLDVKPDNTDRVYRAWKNTDVWIRKGRNPVNIEIENCCPDKVGTIPYFYESRPVISNGYYGNQNMVCPCPMYPSYKNLP